MFTLPLNEYWVVYYYTAPFTTLPTHPYTSALPDSLSNPSKHIHRSKDLSLAIAAAKAAAEAMQKVAKDPDVEIGYDCLRSAGSAVRDVPRYVDLRKTGTEDVVGRFNVQRLKVSVGGKAPRSMLSFAKKADKEGDEKEEEEKEEEEKEEEEKEEEEKEEEDEEEEAKDKDEEEEKEREEKEKKKKEAVKEFSRLWNLDYTYAASQNAPGR
jgi:flagellar biosynthesis GTPase FlhF